MYFGYWIRTLTQGNAKLLMHSENFGFDINLLHNFELLMALVFGTQLRMLEKYVANLS